MNDSSPNLLYQHRFAVIDHLQFTEAAQEGMFDELRPVGLVPKGMEGDADKLPLCINLAALPDDVCECWWLKLETARRNGEPAIFGALLEAPVAFPEIQRHLTRSLICQGRSKPWKFLLRYYDPRVFAHLVWILKPEQRQLLLGPVTKWTWCHEGKWHALDNPEVAYRKMPLLTTTLQWQHIERIGRYNRVRELAGQFDSRSPADQAVLIDTLFSRAKEIHGLIDEEDQNLFAVHGLRYHPRFDQHPRLLELFQRLDHAETSYRDASALIHPNEWQEIAQEMQQARNHDHAVTNPWHA